MHDRIQDRVDTIMNRIPVGTLRAVLTSKKAWADLKHAANQTKPITKLIMQDELAIQIAARASHRKQYGRKPDRSTKRSDTKKDSLPIAAKELQVPHGVFKQQDGQLLGPLGADQVGPNANGVVIIDQDEADALLRIPTPVSQNGLAVIVLANQANAAAHEIEATRFPVVCMSTQEPLIVAGYIEWASALVPPTPPIGGGPVERERERQREREIIALRIVIATGKVCRGLSGAWELQGRVWGVLRAGKRQP